MGNTRMPTPVRKKNKNGSDKSATWWLRKKVPERYRRIAGRGELWRSLETTDKREAAVLCAKLSAEMEKDWEHRLRAATKAAGKSAPPPMALANRELSGLQRLAHEQIRDAYEHRDPPARYRWGAGLGLRSEQQDDEERENDEAELDAFLASNGFERATAADRARLLPMFLEARREGRKDLHRMTKGDYGKSDPFKDNAAAPTPGLDLPAAFEFYCETAGIKGGARGPTATRWRPKIAAFCEFMKQNDLARITTDDAYRWVDHLIAQGQARKTVRDVWIASLKAVANYLVERGRLDVNPFAKVRVRGVKSTGKSNKKSFSKEQARTILEASLVEPSHLTSAETRACRRWVPWICAYTGARVTEITSLLPSDVRQDPETGIWCFYLRPEVTKGDYERIVPIHSHLLDEQKILDFVDERRRAGLPLFYVPISDDEQDIARQCQKKAQRLADWVTGSLGITGMMPNHAWRHLFKSVSRHVQMHAEVERFITGHGGSDDPMIIDKVSMRYGDAWVATLKVAIEMYPKFEIAGLKLPPAPRKRTRRTPAQIAADRQAKEASGRRRPAPVAGVVVR